MGALKSAKRWKVRQVTVCTVGVLEEDSDFPVFTFWFKANAGSYIPYRLVTDKDVEYIKELLELYPDILKRGKYHSVYYGRCITISEDRKD